ncbi:hypothetical protein ABZ502_20200 [Streptomyces abikoensis]|uniref:hypothetical protein n=1 Tax=Streptomyces abikoensis TaxID=97398 RepID=UPI0033CB3C38
MTPLEAAMDWQRHRRPNRPNRRRRPAAVALAAEAALAASLVGVCSGPATAAVVPASSLCPTGNLCLTGAGIGIPEPTTIRECKVEDFTPYFEVSVVENNTDHSARIVYRGGSLILMPRTGIDSRPPLEITSAGTLC